MELLVAVMALTILATVSPRLGVDSRSLGERV